MSLCRRSNGGNSEIMKKNAYQAPLAEEIRMDAEEIRTDFLVASSESGESQIRFDYSEFGA